MPAGNPNGPPGCLATAQRLKQPIRQCLSQPRRCCTTRVRRPGVTVDVQARRPTRARSSAGSRWIAKTSVPGSAPAADLRSAKRRFDLRSAPRLRRQFGELRNATHCACPVAASPTSRLRVGLPLGPRVARPTGPRCRDHWIAPGRLLTRDPLRRQQAVLAGPDLQARDIWSRSDTGPSFRR